MPHLVKVCRVHVTVFPNITNLTIFKPIVLEFRGVSHTSSVSWSGCPFLQVHLSSYSCLGRMYIGFIFLMHYNKHPEIFSALVDLEVSSLHATPLCHETTMTMIDAIMVGLRVISPHLMTNCSFMSWDKRDNWHHSGWSVDYFAAIFDATLIDEHVIFAYLIIICSQW